MKNRKKSPPRKPLPAAPAYHLAALAVAARIPEGRQHAGYCYRTLNRRIQITLRADGKVNVLMRRLLSREEAQAGGPLDTPAQVLRGRVLHTTLLLSMEAVGAFSHFAGEVLLRGKMTPCHARPVYGRHPNTPEA